MFRESREPNLSKNWSSISVTLGEGSVVTLQRHIRSRRRMRMADTGGARCRKTEAGGEKKENELTRLRLEKLDAGRLRQAEIFTGRLRQ